MSGLPDGDRITETKLARKRSATQRRNAVVLARMRGIVYPGSGRAGGSAISRGIRQDGGKARWPVARPVVRAGMAGAGHTRLLLFSGADFSDAIAKQAAADPSVQLIGLSRLYHGS